MSIVSQLIVKTSKLSMSGMPSKIKFPSEDQTSENHISLEVGASKQIKTAVLVA